MMSLTVFDETEPSTRWGEEVFANGSPRGVAGDICRAGEPSSRGLCRRAGSSYRQGLVVHVQDCNNVNGHWLWDNTRIVELANRNDNVEDNWDPLCWPNPHFAYCSSCGSTCEGSCTSCGPSGRLVCCGLWEGYVLSRTWCDFLPTRLNWKW